LRGTTKGVGGGGGAVVGGRGIVAVVSGSEGGCTGAEGAKGTSRAIECCGCCGCDVAMTEENDAEGVSSGSFLAGATSGTMMCVAFFEDVGAGVERREDVVVLLGTPPSLIIDVKAGTTFSLLVNLSDVACALSNSNKMRNIILTMSLT